MAFRPETAKPLNELVDVLLRGPHTLSPGERELIATYVSSQNDCEYCQTIHGAIAAHHLTATKRWWSTSRPISGARGHLGQAEGAARRLPARRPRGGKQRHRRRRRARPRARARRDLEIHDTVLIAAVFCMCNRYVDGLATWCPAIPISTGSARRWSRQTATPPRRWPARPAKRSDRHDACERLIGAVVVCVLTASSVFAQDPTGAIEGVVTDKTAGAVAAAKVIVKNTDTGFGREAVSGGGRLLPCDGAAGRHLQPHGRGAAVRGLLCRAGSR